MSASVTFGERVVHVPACDARCASGGRVVERAGTATAVALGLLVAGCGGGHPTPVDAPIDVPETAHLTVVVAGTGAGAVTSSPAGMDCDATCTASFPLRAQVTLTAAAATGAGFDGWDGACAGSQPTCQITLTGDTAVTARFTPTLYTVTVAIAGNGAGIVASTPGGIWCPWICSRIYDIGTSVTLSQSPAPLSTFIGWSGDCSGAGACVVTLDRARFVTANFDVQSFLLTVARNGSGTGRVTSSPAGVDCGTDCTESYRFGTSVTLTASAESGSRFAGWSGGTCSGTGTCTFDMLDTTRTVAATFDAVPPNDIRRSSIATRPAETQKGLASLRDLSAFRWSQGGSNP